MPVNITPGMQVVAKGKVSIIQRALDYCTVEVVFVGSGEIESVKLDDIEFLAQPDQAGLIPLSTKLAAEAKLEDLEQAAIRFNVVEQLKLGNISPIKAADQLGSQRIICTSLQENTKSNLAQFRC
ncbi:MULTISPECIES: hypothetical protein [unclassified Pseudomonas]|mgnify:CR=1 FL=1|uniref:hypothetical protein n=1 Tax=unclassified Pseudomonas TaxID=196821 RepID=UPI002E80EDE8|nr:hypothetical protein [Pseudomonas sp. 10C3]MEE3509586.1 hypothetical protein [Pseudomonas sp. 10C3]